MTPLVGFLVFLAVTLALLGGVVATGLRAQRRKHIPLVVLTVAALLTTIYYAEQLGKTLDLEAAGWIYPVHLKLAVTATVAYLLPVVTGVMTIRNAKHRKLHGRVAFAVITLTVLTAITGTWMVIAAPPLAD